MPVFGAPGKPGTLSIATASTKESRRWRNGEITWAELKSWLKEPAHRKECGGYVLGKLVSDLGPRTRENLAERSALSLDADKAQPGFLDRVASALDGVAWLAHTTYSSTTSEPRWRVIIPLDRPIDPDTYMALTRVLLKRMNAEEFDVAASTRPEQFMWRPAVPEGVKLRHRVADGPSLYLDDYAVPMLDEMRSMLAEEREASAALIIAIDREPSPEELEAAEALLAHETDRVANALPGERNETVSSALYRLFRFVKSGCLDEDRVVHALEDVAPFGNGYSMTEFRASLDGARRKAPAEWPRLAAAAADDFGRITPELAAELGIDLTVPLSPPAPRTPKDKDVQRVLYDLQVGDAAKALFRASKEPPREPLAFITPAEAALLPPQPPFRVTGLIPPDGFTTLVAQNKSGKTTMTQNLVRSLLGGQPFLGCFPVTPVEGGVAFLNYEMSASTFHTWTADMGIVDDRFLTLHLRGRPNPFGHPEGQAELGRLLAAHDIETLIIDPFGKAYTGESQNDATEVRAWLTLVDDIARGAGVRDIVLVVHTGWDGSRSRGSSALEDHPDSKVYLEKQDVDGQRVFTLRAEGRDVDVPKGIVTLDAATRLLTYVAPEESAAGAALAKADRANSVEDDVISVVRGQPGIGIRGVMGALPHKRTAVDDAIKRLEITRKLERRVAGRTHELYLLEDSLDDDFADTYDDIL